jgi:hypothetical protein
VGAGVRPLRPWWGAMLGTWDNISDAIFHFAEIRPEAPAIIDGGRTHSWREFAALVGAAARHASMARIRWTEGSDD